MTMRVHRYRPLGQCMYCLAAGVKLSEEHVVPRSLNGTLTLRDSVCDPCRIRTGRREQAALAADLVVPRILLALKRRRARKKGPRRLPAVVLANGDANDAACGSIRLDLNANDYPRSFSLPGFEPAGMLAGVDRASGAQGARRIACRLDVGPRHAAGDALACSTADPADFAWSLAKWAYSFAVAERGLACCDMRAMRQLMAGERDDVFNFVGGPGADTGAPAARGALHALALVERDGWLIVDVALFACAGMAPYRVVVGASDAAVG